MDKALNLEAERVAFELAAKYGRKDTFDFRIPGTSKVHKVECVIMEPSDVASFVAAIERRATYTSAPEAAVQAGSKTAETRMDAGSQPLFATGAAPGELQTLKSNGVAAQNEPDLAINDAPGELPPLPKAAQKSWIYTAAQMREYAAAAVAADRAQRAAASDGPLIDEGSIAQRAAVEPAPGAGIDGWISVDERLPKPEESVLIAMADGRIEKTCWWSGEFLRNSLEQPTHWRPLPAAPCNDQHKEPQ